ncbi:MAG: hypothetical protein E5V92_21260 [Mesorhizobium sp.]|nr:MAG: hypothetical protein E5V92_21260 [Mesorhizobium sp.]
MLALRAAARAFQRFIESPNRSKYLFLRNSERKTVTHFSWNCTSTESQAFGAKANWPMMAPSVSGSCKRGSSRTACRVALPTVLDFRSCAICVRSKMNSNSALSTPSGFETRMSSA